MGLLVYGLITRTLAPEVFGSWVLFLTVFTVFDLVRSGLLSNALIREVSGADENHARLAAGTAFRLSLGISLLFGLLCFLTYLIWGRDSGEPTFRLIGYGGGLLAVLSIPHTLSVWLINAHQRYRRLLFVHLSIQTPMLIIMLVVYLTGGDLQHVFLSYLLANAVVCAVTVLMGWAEPRNWRFFSGTLAKEMLHFGKFSMGTLLGTSLLRSSDTFLLMSWLGPAPVGLYNVPERVLNIMEIPIRAFITTAFPQLTALGKRREHDEFGKVFEREAGALTWLLIPLALFIIVFAEWVVLILAGSEYLEAANLLRIFVAYALLIPIDRYSGVALDALGIPKANFYKVIGMLTVNVVGDAVVLSLGGGVVEVALVSVFTYTAGIILGLIYLRRHIRVNPVRGMREGRKRLVNKLRERLKK